MHTLPSLAKEVLKRFETHARDNGESYHYVNFEGVDWINDLCREAHDGMLPDDWKYAFIHKALSAIAELDDDATEDDARDVSIDQDPYTHDLLKWLASNLERPGFCDAAVEECGAYPNEGGIVAIIGMGQYLEKREILNSVVSSLQARLDELNTAP